MAAAAYVGRIGGLAIACCGCAPISTCPDTSATTEVVLRALHEHGAVIFDSTTPGRDGAKLLAMSNGWAGTEHLAAQAELNTVPMSAFDVVDVSGILVDPATGWQIQS